MVETLNVNGDGGPRDFGIEGAKVPNRVVGYQIHIASEDLIEALGFQRSQFKLVAIERYVDGMRIVVSAQ